MLIFYGHPFSSYTWKALIALYEKGVEFDYRVLEPDAPQHEKELKTHWPVGQFPLLVPDGAAYFESSILIEYLDHLVHEQRLTPADFDAATPVEFFHHLFANHVV